MTFINTIIHLKSQMAIYQVIVPSKNLSFMCMIKINVYYHTIPVSNIFKVGLRQEARSLYWQAPVPKNEKSR